MPSMRETYKSRVTIAAIIISVGESIETVNSTFRENISYLVSVMMHAIETITHFNSALLTVCTYFCLFLFGYLMRTSSAANCVRLNMGGPHLETCHLTPPDPDLYCPGFKLVL